MGFQGAGFDVIIRTKLNGGMILVEAAILWPIIFVVLVFLIAGCCVLYTQTVLSASMHQAQRQGAGLRTGTVSYESCYSVPGKTEDMIAQCLDRELEQNRVMIMPSDCLISFTFFPVYPKVSITGCSVYNGGIWMENSWYKEQKSILDVVDEAQLIVNYQYAVELWDKR